jgi:hypothetical protein
MRDCSHEELAVMSHRRSVKYLVRMINEALKPLVWSSGYCDHTESDDRLKLYAPEKPKKFRGLELKEIEVIGFGWYSDNAVGGGMATIDFGSMCLCNLILIYEWVITLKPRAKK